MDFKQLSYIVTIAEEQTIAKAADKLFLSRPALNHYLLSLENSLGIKIFNRINRKMILTYAGELYVESAMQILNIQKQTQKTLAEIAGSQKGRINLGITHGCAEMFCHVFPLFHERYPQFTINLVEGSVHTLESSLLSGKTDIAVIGHAVISPPELEHIPIHPCEVVLMLPPDHPLAFGDQNCRTPHGVFDLRLLKDSPFVLMEKNTGIRTIADQHFSAAGFTPNTLVEFSQRQMAYHMVQAGVAPSILMSNCMPKENDGVTCYSLTPKEIWTQSLAFRRGTVFGEAEKCFIEMIRDYYNSIEL